MKILIVDDSRVMRQIVIRTLRQAGFDGHEIIEAADGRQGFEAVITRSPDLVLSDWNMPELNGIDMLLALREAGNHTPLAFITSEGSADMVGRAEQAGALALITKPFTADTFREKLGALIS